MWLLVPPLPGGGWLLLPSERLGLLVRQGSVLPTARLRLGQAALPEALPLALASSRPSRGVVVSATTLLRAAILAVAAGPRPWSSGPPPLRAATSMWSAPPPVALGAQPS
jgi:hypothetical protein